MEEYSEVEAVSDDDDDHPVTICEIYQYWARKRPSLDNNNNMNYYNSSH